MTNNGSDYLPELQAEKDKIDEVFVHANRLLAIEIDRVQTGGAEKGEKLIELHHDRPQKIVQKICIPTKEFPKINFVGKLLGPKGLTLKKLQEETGTKMAVLGRGSMRDKKKEEELRQQGGKYAHLNDELHLQVEAFAPPPDAFSRLAHATAELKKFLIPEFSEEIRQQQFEDMAMLESGGGGGAAAAPAPFPRGRGRGGPPPGRGRAAPLLASPPGRGGMSRGGPRGAMRGGGMGARGGAAPRGRSAPEALLKRPGAFEQDYGYGQESRSAGYDDYSGGYGDSSYDDGYDQGSEGQFFDYGHSTTSQRQDYGNSWGSSQGSYGKSPVAKGNARAHPYGGSGRGRY